MLAKSLTLTSDNITYDLEDSVTAASKAAARAALREHLSSLPARPGMVGEVAVRINSVSGGRHALEDLTAVAALERVDAVVVPKVRSAADLTFVAEVLRHVAPRRHHASSPSSSSSSPSSSQSPSNPRPITILALIESARAVMDLRSICEAGGAQLGGLIFAAEDFALDLSLTRTPGLGEFLYARSAIATAARAFDLPSTIDLVCTSYKGPEGLRRLEEECRNGRQMGFNGKRE